MTRRNEGIVVDKCGSSRFASFSNDPDREGNERTGLKECLATEHTHDAAFDIDFTIRARSRNAR
jgi:hypothetical protein